MAAGPWSQLGAFFLLWERLGAFFPGKIQQLNFLQRLAAGGSRSSIPTQHRHQLLTPSPAAPGPMARPPISPSHFHPQAKQEKTGSLFKGKAPRTMKGKAESETPSPSMQLGRSSHPQGLTTAAGMEEANAKGGKQHHRSPLGLDSPLAKAKHVLLL